LKAELLGRMLSPFFNEMNPGVAVQRSASLQDSSTPVGPAPTMASAALARLWWTKSWMR
jgi:hypothetical protein